MMEKLNVGDEVLLCQWRTTEVRVKVGLCGADLAALSTSPSRHHNHHDRHFYTATHVLNFHD
jgi:hypothetical protein